MEKEKIAIVAAAPETVISFMSDHIKTLSSHYDVYVLCSNTCNFQDYKIHNFVHFINVLIKRNISIFQDFISLFRLIFIFYKHNFTLVQSITPKAGLLAMLAAWICKIPVRIHVFTGQVWVTKGGFSRWYLKTLDRLIAMLATSVLADSSSQKKFLVSAGIAKEKDIVVLADGSICGVDSSRFKPNWNAKVLIRSKLGIPQDATVALFVGRIKKDKGVLDLVRAFGMIHSDITNLFMIFVGPDEENLGEQIIHLSAHRFSQIRLMDSVNNPEDFFAAADFLCLPSYREGFGLVIIEAAASGIPTLASRIYGITDAIVDGATGLLHQPGDLVGITKGLLEMTINSSRRQIMGDAARRRALMLFPTSRLVEALLQHYQLLIQKFRSYG